MTLRERVLKLLFPPRCMFCGRVIEDGHWCSGCFNSLPRAGVVRKGGQYYTCSIAALRYEGSVRRAAIAMKFHGKTANAAGFAKLLSETVKTELAGRFDLVSWVPVSVKRLRERGYDQSELIARHTAELLGAEVAPTLKKIRHTPAQSGLQGKDRRRANVNGAYMALSPEAVRDRRILLIDDILTTGATMAECSRMLLMAGAEDVIAAAAIEAGRQ